MKKPNCWDFFKCGREPGGEKTKEFGVCPASVETSAHGLNGGINGGRFCWAIAGTYSVDKSRDKDRCDITQKVSSCYKCRFHKKVLKEEGILV